MNTPGRFPTVLLVCCASAFSCGDNLGEPPDTEEGNIPGLTALALNASTIRFAWEAAQGVPDSLRRGYAVRWGARNDSLPLGTRTYTLDSLPSGEVVFTVSARVTGGMTAPSATIRWAPAARFDTPLTLMEYYAGDIQRIAGLDAGGTTGGVVGLAIDPSNTTVAQTMDLYLFGGEGEQEEPLQLRSASILFGTWSSTVFSSVAHDAPSLDYPLARFPEAATFTLASVPVTDNTIRYARITGDQGGTHVIRIHVRTIPGGVRSRSVELRISLQRVPGLPYAGLQYDGSRHHCPNPS